MTSPELHESETQGSGRVRFTEEMKGWVTFGERDYHTGHEHGRADRNDLMFHLTIETPDIAEFIADRRHEASATGWVDCHALGGRREATGKFNLFVPTDDPSESRMLYRLHFHDGVGRPLTLSGFKRIRNDPGIDLWPDTSTLYTSVFHGHVGADEEAGAELVCSGILRIHKLDFARQLTTFRARGATHTGQLRALVDFNRLFAGELLRIYKAEAVLTVAAGLATAAGAKVVAGRGLRARRRVRARRSEHRQSQADAGLGHLGPFQLRWGTWLAGFMSVASGAILLGAEGVRVWRLGTLPLSRTETQANGASRKRITPLRAVAVLREGYRVSSTRENTMFNTLAAFLVTLGITRGITIAIRTRGGLGPIRNMSAGGRHIHHFIPGMVISFMAGGVSVTQGRDPLDRMLAIPFGVGTALVVDEVALLLELEDVYWTEKGVLSVQASFAIAMLLSAIAYAQQVRRRGRPGTESDWLAAAAAWDSLQQMGRSRIPG